MAFFIETTIVRWVRHMFTRLKRQCCCALRMRFTDGSDRPLSASEIYDKFHRFAHESKFHFKDNANQLHLGRNSIFDLLYALSVDGRHRELYARLHTKMSSVSPGEGALDDEHHHIVVEAILPENSQPGTRVPVRFVGAHHEVYIKVPTEGNHTPGQLCSVSLDREAQSRLGPFECLYLSETRS